MPGVPDEKPYVPGGGDDGYGGGEGLYTTDPTAPQQQLPGQHPGQHFPPQAMAMPYPPQPGPVPQKVFPGGPSAGRGPVGGGLPIGGYSQPAPPYTETALPYVSFLEPTVCTPGI